MRWIRHSFYYRKGQRAMETGMTALCMIIACLSILSSQGVEGRYAPRPTLQRSKLLQVGYSNIEGDVEGPAKVDWGEVPPWLNGTFMRHSCGAFGDIPDDLHVNLQWVDHLFDCIGMGTSFTIEGGKVHYASRYWPTAINSVYSDLGRNMSKSKVFWKTVLADFDPAAAKAEQPSVQKYVKAGQPLTYPQVSWWKVWRKVSARTESFEGRWVDVHSAKDLGPFPFTDHNMGLPPETVLIDDPAHEQYDEQGRPWSVVGAYNFVSKSTVNARLLVYRVNKGLAREIVTDYPLGIIDLSACYHGSPYPDLDARQGYMHSFVMTTNYVILPVTSWLLDPCALFTNMSSPDKPFFSSVFEFYSNHSSYFLVIRKSDGKVIAKVKTKAFFVTHQINAYEEGGVITIDMITYKNASVYLYGTRIDTLLLEKMDGVQAFPERFRLRMSDWSLVDRKYLLKKNPDHVEMSNINNAYRGRHYKYAYFLHKGWITGGGILKLDVERGTETLYQLPDGLYPQEPSFVPRPRGKGLHGRWRWGQGTSEEDNGLILTQGVDANQRRAFMMILDARTMKPVAKVTAPGLALFGIHNKFFPADDL